MDWPEAFFASVVAVCVLFGMKTMIDWFKTWKGF